MEAFSSINTIFAFGAEGKLVDKYKGYLEIAKGYRHHKIPIVGLQYCFDDFVMLGAHALAFWYGTILVLNGEITNGGQPMVMFVVFPYYNNLLSTEMINSVILCMNGAAQAVLNVKPSLKIFAKAGAVAETILKTIHRELQFDSMSDEGIIPEQVQGRIELRDVCFVCTLRDQPLPSSMGLIL